MILGQLLSAGKSYIPTIARVHLAGRLTLNPENNKTALAQQIAYIIHPHCWLLVGRVIGFGLVEANPKTFLTAVERLWAQNAGLWCKEPWKVVWYEIDSNPNQRLKLGRYVMACDDDNPNRIPVWENPAVVPRIQKIIQQATRKAHANRRSRGTLPGIPLDIAIQIVELTKLSSIKDTRNMLAEFGWRLPDSYWKKHSCKMN